ncbi:unnamed protein product [Ambrosiozyma monospora]|uniref:Unnamed protein product n=1 Tax=Ambrosiozyma monospora TaxID=43982 RepID=A0A9W6Z322_AMBMO|nr:unnamed protein product [Ambrosiozyma monospora]
MEIAFIQKIPIVQAASGLELVSLLNSYNVGDNYWLLDNNKEYLKQLNYNIKFIGNRFVLPKTNKRTPPAASPVSTPTSPVLGSSALSSPSIGPSPSVFTSASTKTYSSSILSPFNADSEFFNSVLPFEWIQRYREQRPFVFISVHELATKADNIDLTVADKELANEISRIKNQCTNNNVKHLSIILCSKSIALNPELDERVAQLRKVTSLAARSGLLFLPAGTQREVENFAASVAHLIRPWAVEYFNALEKKFKKRTLQNLEYPEKFWLARQALKIAIAAEMKGISEYSTKSMEYCYEKMIDATRQLDMASQPKLWQQCRMWLDFAGIHITRAYFILGDSNQAYKKFDIHIQNVMAIMPNEIIQTYPVMGWVSLQFTWLSQLIELVPEALVPIDKPYQMFTKNKWFSDGMVSDLPLPHGGYLYLQACSLMRRRHQLAIGQSEANLYNLIDPYMSLPLEEELKFEYHSQCVKLLSSALDFFSRGKKTKFSRSEAYIYFQLGEEYFAMKNYGLAIINFLVSLTAYKNEGWNSIVSNILFRLYQCSIKSNNHRDAALHFIQLSLMDQKLIQPFKKFLDIKEIDSSKFEGDVLFKESLFDKLIAFKEQSLSLSDRVNLQIVLTPKVNDLIEKLEIEELVIDFHGGFKKIRVLNDPTAEAQTFNEFKDGEKDSKELSLKCNLNFDDKKAKCFNFELIPNKIGNFSIQSINLKIKESSLEFSNQLRLVPYLIYALWLFQNSQKSKWSCIIHLGATMARFSLYLSISKIRVWINTVYISL